MRPDFANDNVASCQGKAIKLLVSRSRFTSRVKLLIIQALMRSIHITFPMTTSTSQFQPLAIVHFDELSVIWENDRRIPSPASRRAWAVARNLNPVNVHSWWYRRKAVAKKLRFRIPKGTYELEVGTPPVVEPVVKAEIVDSEMAQCKSECDDDPGEEHCSLVPSDGQSSATTLFSSLPPSSPILRPSSATSASGRAYSPREAGKPTDSHDFCSTNSTTRPNSTSIVDICVRLKLDSPFQRSSDSDMVCSGGGDPSSPFTCVLCTLHEAGMSISFHYHCFLITFSFISWERRKRIVAHS